MSKKTCLEERVVQLTPIWRALANREMPWVWDNMEISNHVANLLARFLPKVIDFADRLKEKEKPATVRDVDLLYSWIEDILEPERKFTHRLCWMPDELAEAALVGMATEMEIEEGRKSILDLVGSEAPDTPEDELLENLILVHVYFEGSARLFPQTSYDSEKPDFDPTVLAAKVRAVVAQADRERLLAASFDSFQKDYELSKYPQELVRAAMDGGVLSDLVPADYA